MSTRLEPKVQVYQWCWKSFILLCMLYAETLPLKLTTVCLHVSLTGTTLECMSLKHSTCIQLFFWVDSSGYCKVAWTQFSPCNCGKHINEIWANLGFEESWVIWQKECKDGLPHKTLVDCSLSAFEPFHSIFKCRQGVKEDFVFVFKYECY